MQGIKGRFNSDAALLAATYRLTGFEVVVAVDPHGPGLHPARDPVGTAQIAGPKSTTQAIDAIVHRSKHLRLVIPSEDPGDRAEDLFLRDAHIVSNIFKQGWLHEQARLEPGYR